MQQSPFEEIVLEPSAPPVSGAETISFSTLLDLLLAGRRTILLSGVACFVLVAVCALLLPNTYKATTSFVPPGSNSVNSSSAAMMGQLSALGAGSLLARQGAGGPVRWHSEE